MIKYLKYFVSSLLLILALLLCFNGKHYPTFFFLGFSLFIIMGDIFLGKDTSIEKYKYPVLINLPIYLNLSLLLILVMAVIFIFGNQNPEWFVNIFSVYLNIDLLYAKSSVNLADKISLVAITSLYVGVMGTVPGHELTHRKRSKIDMFFGNWLLALSWDCAFAIEHVYGHHKNVGLSSDPATAKRGENIYAFIIKAMIVEQRDAWKIEFDHLYRRGQKPFGVHNRMIIGYLRSLMITMIAFIIGGVNGMFCFLLCALLAKSFLEAINYTEHYGLVRERGKPVRMRHSWNSNHLLSSLYLCNVTRHSDHHRTSTLKFWELNPCDDSAPTLPYGYLGMLYLLLIAPFMYQKLMAKKLIDWDLNYANAEERKLASIQNVSSRIIDIK